MLIIKHKIILFLLIILICMGYNVCAKAAIIKQSVDSDGTVTYYVENEKDRVLAFNSMFSRMETKSKIIYTNQYIGDRDNLYDYINYRYCFQDIVTGSQQGIGDFSGTGVIKDDNLFTYEFYYHETPEQTQYVSKKIRDAIKDNISNFNSDYQKAYFAYNWVINNTKPDYTMSNFSSYSGLTGDGTVCQGYSTLYAAIAKELGLDCHIIFGGVDGSSTNHAWNSIKLDGKWYCVDSTWGDTENKDKYFLVTRNILETGDYGYHKSDMYKEYEDDNEIFATENYVPETDTTLSYVMPTVYNVNMDIYKSNKLDIGEGYSFMLSNPDNIPILFKSENPDIAKVDNNGVITGLSEGTSTITAYNDNLKFSQSCIITVSNKKINTKLTSNNIKLNIKSNHKLTVKNALKNSTLKWYSSNNYVAKVSKSGSITGISSGNCTVTCTVTNGTSITVLKCKVNIEK